MKKSIIDFAEDEALNIEKKDIEQYFRSMSRNICFHIILINQ